MLTEVKKPRDVFYMPQRLLVPLFQRPYVWSQEGQWEPLWNDVIRVAERIAHNELPPPHFLGAVVLQQQPNEIGALPIRTIIDGQQRLTTLQLLLDAVYEEVTLAGHQTIARQVLDLVENADHFLQEPEDKYKVWPTNRDRIAFNEVMSAPAPIDYESLKHADSKLVVAHRYFAQQTREWISEGDSSNIRANALVQTVSSYLQLVVIELLADEDAQEIFETLNARGTPLTAADLIKNLIFQKLDVEPGKAEQAYHQYWEAFETPFWESEVGVGRIKYTRSSLFLSHWLISKTALDIPAREVFSQFKRFLNDYAGEVIEMLREISSAAAFYKQLIERSQTPDGPLTRTELFVYRTATLESETVKPLLIWLFDKTLVQIPDDQIARALDCIESWMVRRGCVRATTKRYNLIFSALLNELMHGDRVLVGDLVENFFKKRTSESDYWPGDDEVRKELLTQPIYIRARRARLRMMLEAIEDERRGFNTARPLHEQRVVRGTCTIEHVMPQEWAHHWPIGDGTDSVRRRNALIHTLGNLSLVTKSLNSKVSNAAWLGDSGKQSALKEHTSLKITQEIVEHDHWTEELILDRTERLIDEILAIWTVPSDHIGRVTENRDYARFDVSIADLLQVGMLQVGQEIHARKTELIGKCGVVAADGRIFIGDQAFDSPSGAAKALAGTVSEHGWWFWLVDPVNKVALMDLRREYLAIHNQRDSDSEEFLSVS